MWNFLCEGWFGAADALDWGARVGARCLGRLLPCNGRRALAKHFRMAVRRSLRKSLVWHLLRCRSQPRHLRVPKPTCACPRHTSHGHSSNFTDTCVTCPYACDVPTRIRRAHAHAACPCSCDVPMLMRRARRLVGQHPGGNDPILLLQPHGTGAPLPQQ